MDEPDLTDDQIYEGLRIYFPALFSQEAMDQGITKEYIVRAYKEDATGNTLREAENVVLKNKELKRITSLGYDTNPFMSLSLEELKEFPLSLSSGSYSSPGNPFSLLPNDVLSKIGVNAGKVGGLGITKSTQKKVRAVRRSPLYWKESVELLLGFELPEYRDVDWKELHRQVKSLEHYYDVDFDNPDTDIDDPDYDPDEGLVRDDIPFPYRRWLQPYEMMYLKATCLGYLTILTILDTYYKIDKNKDQYLKYALLAGKPEVLEYLLRDRNLDTKKLYLLARIAFRTSNLKCIELIFNDDRVKSSWVSDTTPYYAIQRGIVDVFKFIWFHPKFDYQSSGVEFALCGRFHKELHKDNEDAKIEILDAILSNEKVRNGIMIEECVKKTAYNGYYRLMKVFLSLPGGELVSPNLIFNAATSYDRHYPRGDSVKLPSPMSVGRRKIALEYIDKVDQDTIREAYDAAVENNVEFIYSVLETYIRM